MGAMYALAASLCSATVGVLCRWGFSTQLDHVTLSFMRAAAGLAIVTAILLVSGRWGGVPAIVQYAPRLAIAAFFGVFGMYSLEVWAVSLTSVATVSFLLYAGGVLAVIPGWLRFRESVSWQKAAAILLVLVGIHVTLAGMLGARQGFVGPLLAIAAGVAYSLFLVLVERFGIPSGLPSLWWLLAFGTLYLCVPMLVGGASAPRLTQLPAIVALALIPTVGGFCFTARALGRLKAGRVRVHAMGEPVFASVFALVALGERMDLAGVGGASLILAGTLLVRFGRGMTGAGATPRGLHVAHAVVPSAPALAEDDPTGA